ncbi:RUN and SH3 domain containing 1 isoform X2 [Brachyhypopomus gauderio]|uniref:RUN and SH3 domain containing 1 isoform X2 n=1 Tax=Brachyhypopomus gauderio TaxID=698409 RepID=UPI004042AA87
MHSARPSVPPRPRRFDSGRRVDPKPLNHTNKREEKNINTVSSSPRHVTRRPPEPSRLKSIGHTARSSVGHLKVVQKNSAHPVPANSKSKGGHGASNAGIPAVDPNCNEPSLPCLCCNDHPTQDSNSLFNHNHNNNNTVTIRQQLKFAPPSQKRKEAEKKPETRKAKCKPEEKQPMTEPIAKPVEDREEENGNVKETEGGDHKDDDAGDNVKEMEGGDQKDDDAGVNVKGKVDENGNGNNDVVVDGAADDDNDDEDDDDDEDENTLVPSCCDCPASLLDFSLTSSTSSSSTSISSCSDLDSDCPDGFSTSLQEQEATENYPSPHSSPSHTTAFQPYSLPLDLSTSVRPPSSSCSPDEGYPSPSTSPTSDFLDNKEPEEEKSIKVDVLNFLDSIDELGKVDCFYRIAQVAQWEFEGDLDLRDRLLHQEKLEKVNRQVKLTYLERLQEAGRDFDDEDLSGLVDEMGNIDISWKFYKSDKSYDSQDYSDAGVDMTAPSDLDEPTVPDSLAPSPIDPPPRPPKPPARHVSAQSEMHTYMNISGNTPSVSSNSSPTKSLSLAVPPSPSSLSSAISKPLALPPQPPQPVPYFTLYTESPAVSSPAPPIPPPRRRHKARLEAQRLAELAREKTPQSLPAPTTRPPPLPPPPAMTSPPAIPPPPSLPPPPSFHALDVEIRKLLALAGITQAELLRLSPELGVCVDGVLEEEEKSKVSKNGNVCANKTSKSEKEEVCKGNELSWKDERIEENGLGKNSLKEVISLDALNKEEAFIDEKEECKDTFRTTSFTEMARRRKRNGGSSNSSCSCGLGDDSTLKADSYYSTGISNKQFTDASFGSFDYQYASVIPDSPPPPPPRPLPPRPRLLSDPPELPPLKPCTLPANASLPDRFDWLIAFTPDTEAPPLEIKKSLADSTPQKSNSGPKVTTFKELRNRGKQASPPTRVQPEPDPTIVTPDPDFLYNLKWRREKADGDGTQWEYTSQAQATFLQPPPTPASLALFREIRHLNIEGNVSLELSSLQRIGCSTNKPNWGPFDEDPKTEHHKKKEKVEDEKETEVRGTADGGRTWESRTRVPSPPLTPALPRSLPSPYYLHSDPPCQAPLFYRSDFYRSQTKGCPLQQTPKDPVVRENLISDTCADSLYCTEFVCKHENTSSGNIYNNSDRIIDSLYHSSQYSAIQKDKVCNYGKDSVNKYGSLYDNCSDSSSNVDSHNRGDKYTVKSLKLFTDFDEPAAREYSDGDTTPYKNFEMISYVNAEKLNRLRKANRNSEGDIKTLLSLNSNDDHIPLSANDSFSGQNSDLKNMKDKTQTPPFPTLYLYHPKNCPLHKGAPPRLSPVGAISPPCRAGPLSPGTDVSRLRSPLTPRSHTLPALAAPFYYPYLYPAPLWEPPAPTLTSEQSSPPPSLTVRSVSFTGPVAKSGTWMGDDARTHLRGDELSSLCLQEKRALVSAVSVAVEAILAQFSSSRTLVQKALSGDSSVNPTLGRLLLQCLCPALRGLLCDGLKPHQSDLIAGRRPNSPWGLVLASTKPGSSTQALYNLKAKVSALPQLRQNRHRFNAFLLGLLNIKRLDFWLSHVQACSDVLETYYRRTAFMRLAGTSCKPLFDELLLLLQPLSLLTFNIDLLFQHHHLDPSSPDLTPSGRSPDPSSPPGQDPRFCSSQSQVSGPHLRGVSMQDFGDLDSKAASLNSVSLRSFNARSLYCRPISSGIGKGETTPQLQWLQEKEIAPPSVGSVNILTQQAGQALQQGWGAVLRWGERLGQNWSGLSSFGSSEEPEGLQRVEDLSTDAVSSARQKPGQELSTADSGAVLWDLGRLFGASKSPTNPPMKRRPSQWLSPGITILSRMTSTGQNFLPEKIEPVRNMEKEMRKDEDKEMDQPKPLRAVRTLCDHTGNGAELSFRKGEELILLGGVDQDWIRCRQGDKEGLVPIGFASLIM